MPRKAHVPRGIYASICERDDHRDWALIVMLGDGIAVSENHPTKAAAVDALPSAVKRAVLGEVPTRKKDVPSAREVLAQPRIAPANGDA